MLLLSFIATLRWLFLYQKDIVMGKKITEEDMRLNFIFNAESGKKDLLAAEKQLQVLINKQEKWNDQIKERGLGQVHEYGAED